jgi:hypothetical protein
MDGKVESVVELNGDLVAKGLVLQVQKEPESNNLVEMPIPENWTYLLHGANLDRREWMERGVEQLDADIFEIKGWRGLSAIDKRDRDYMRERNITGYDVTNNYALGKGGHLEMRVMFPAFHSQFPLSESARAKLVEKYGEQRVKDLYDLGDEVFWKNDQHGRHPVLPTRMRLVKIMDQTLGENNRLVQYVPEVLMDIYKEEVGFVEKT